MTLNFLLIQKRRSMLGRPCRYLEHLHKTAEKVSSVTSQEVSLKNDVFSGIQLSEYSDANLRKSRFSAEIFF